MNKQKKSSYTSSVLREKAEKELKKRTPKKDSSYPEADTLKLIHELEVYQIELEMQNEELRRTKIQADLASEKYAELYDSAPSGFFTLSRDGKILGLNLCGSQILDKDRIQLVNSNFGFFISDATKPRFNTFLDKVFNSNVNETCEVTLIVRDNEPMNVLLTGICDKNGAHSQVTVVDLGITERKQAEEILKKSEERRLAILETAMDGFWLLDRHGSLLEVNKTYCMMSGYSAQELLVMQVSDLEVIETSGATVSHIQKIMTQGEDRFETRHRRKDGSIFDVEISVQYQSTNGGQLVTFLHDVTERKQAEVKLRQSEERYKSLFQGNHSVMLLVDPGTGEIKDANQAASLYYGWAHAEICNKNIAEINTLTKEEVNAEMLKVKEEKRNQFFFKHRLSNGEVRDVEIYSGPIKFREVTLLYSIVHDITERKQAEEALWENERLLRESQKAAQIGSYSTDLKAGTWKASPEMYEIFGIDETYPHTVNGWLGRIHPDFIPELTSDLLGGEKKVFDHEYKIIRHHDGTEQWVHGIGEFEYDNLMNPVRLIGTIQNITKRKQAEEALKQLNEELEDRVKERTAELFKSNAALAEAERKYRTVADHTYGWEFWSDQHDIILYCSPSCERITGYKASAFMQHPALLIEIIHPDDLKSYLSHKQKEKIGQDCNHEIQYRIIRADGSIKWIGHICQPIFNESGDFIGNRGSNRDITRQKNIERLLKTSNQKYKLLSENISDGIFICRNGCFEYINKAINRIFGYDDRQLEGLKLTQLVTAEYQEELEKFLAIKGDVNQIRNIEIECLKRDGAMVFVEILFNYVANEGVIYGVIHDITEQKQVQKNIFKAIIQTEEKERAYFSKELHDGLGPLLSLIKLYIQSAQRPKGIKSREVILLKAEDVLNDALRTVKEISNKLSPHVLTNYGLTSAIQSFVDKIEKISAISIDFHSNAGRRVDIEIETALYRAVIECINNTVKHAMAKNINIMMNDSGSQIHLQYSDDGIGYDFPETLSAKKGLGLFNLQNRIQTIGGKITMFSKPGKGVDYQINVNVPNE